jgi:hypothetical protein
MRAGHLTEHAPNAVAQPAVLLERHHQVIGHGGETESELAAAPSSKSSHAEATPSTEEMPSWAVELSKQMEQLDAKVSRLLEHRTIKDWYGTEEVAQIVGKAEFTVREWCRNGRVHAQKKGSGRGKYQSWVISHEELQRLQREGLLAKRKS